MKVHVLSIEGQKVHEIDLPKVFETPIDENLIKRSVQSIESAAMQPYGTKPGAGRNYTAVYIASRGKPAMHRIMNTERARLPHLKNRRYLVSGDVALIPHAVGGPMAHPPKAEKVRKEKINLKEKRKATKSAIAATAVKEMVKKRGHKISDTLIFPLIVETKFEQLDKTKKVIEALGKLSLGSDLQRARDGKKRRAGAGKSRGRKYKKTKSVLIVVGDSKKIYKAARNIEGVDIINVKNLNAKLLAPGAVAGRLTLWSESAIKFLGEEK